MEPLWSLAVATGGLLITYGDRLSRSDFTDVRANGVPLRILEMNAIVLPARQRGVVAATTPVDIEAGEPVNLVYTCSDLYMTAMGRAVFAGEYARRELGLDARSHLRYRVDNPTLRALLQPFDHVLLPRLTATGR